MNFGRVKITKLSVMSVVVGGRLDVLLPPSSADETVREFCNKTKQFTLSTSGLY